MANSRLLLAVLPAALLAGCGSTHHTTTTPPSKRVVAPKRAAALGADAPGIIAFHRFTDADQTTARIWLIKPDGTGEHPLTNPAPDEIDDQPSISPDGTKVAYEVCGDACRAIVVSIDGTHRRVIHLACPNGPVCDTQAPAFGPDGSLLVNRSYGKPGPDDDTKAIDHSQLIVLGPSLRGPGRIVASSKYEDADFNNPFWSPDGKKIGYEYARATPTGIKVALRIVDVDSGATRQITPFSLGAGDSPDWSPDGQWIVFRTHADSDTGPTDLELIHPDGSGRRNLTHFGSSGNRVLSSSFSPDGQWIVYAGQHGSDPPRPVRDARGRDRRSRAHAHAAVGLGPGLGARGYGVTRRISPPLPTVAAETPSFET